MRKSFILAPLAVAVLAGGATGVANAADAEPSATPTTVPGMPGMPDLETVMSVLTPDQLVCIAESIGSVDVASDPVAAMTALTDCGVSMEQLMQIAAGETSDTVAGETTSLPDGEMPDAETIAAVLELLGIDDTDLACLSGALAVPPANDTAALAVLTGCDISLTELLQSIVTVGTGGTTAATLPTVTTVAGTAAATGNPIADLLIQQFSAMGMTLTTEQATCIADQITSGSIDPATIGQDMTALTNLLATCGIDIADLMGG